LDKPVLCGVEGVGEVASALPAETGWIRAESKFISRQTFFVFLSF
jgi:hypothetical protein